MTPDEAVKRLDGFRVFLYDARLDSEDCEALRVLLAEREEAEARLREVEAERDHITAGYHRRKEELDAQYAEVRALRETLARIERRLSEGQGSQPWCSCAIDLGIVREEIAALAQPKGESR